MGLTIRTASLVFTLLSALGSYSYAAGPEIVAQSAPASIAAGLSHYKAGVGYECGIGLVNNHASKLSLAGVVKIHVAGDPELGEYTNRMDLVNEPDFLELQSIVTIVKSISIAERYHIVPTVRGENPDLDFFLVVEGPNQTSSNISFFSRYSGSEKSVNSTANLRAKELITRLCNKVRASKILKLSDY
jgi:hypothetical protein